MEGRMTVCNMSIEWGAKRRHDRPRPDDLRLPRGPSTHAPNRRASGTTPSTYWSERCAPTTTRSSTRRSSLDAARRMSPFVTWGTNPGQGVHRCRRQRSRSRRLRWTTLDAGNAARKNALDVHGPRARGCRCARSPSTPCSWARARTGVSRTCARPPKILDGPTGRGRRCGCSSCPGPCGCANRPRKKGLDVGVHRGRRPNGARPVARCASA